MGTSQNSTFATHIKRAFDKARQAYRAAAYHPRAIRLPVPDSMFNYVGMTNDEWYQESGTNPYKEIEIRETTYGSNSWNACVKLIEERQAYEDAMETAPEKEYAFFDIFDLGSHSDENSSSPTPRFQTFEDGIVAQAMGPTDLYRLLSPYLSRDSGNTLGRFLLGSMLMDWKDRHGEVVDIEKHPTVHQAVRTAFGPL